jgi:hypothetical protein
MPHSVNITRATVRIVSTCKDPDLGSKVVHIAATTHHIQLSLDERRELDLHNELYDEHNLPTVMARKAQLRVSAASVTAVGGGESPTCAARI